MRAGDGDRPELPARDLDVAGGDRPGQRDERADERAGQDRDEGDDRVADRQGRARARRSRRAAPTAGCAARPSPARRPTTIRPVAQPRATNSRPNSVVSSRPGPTASRSPGTIARAAIVATDEPDQPDRQRQAAIAAHDERRRGRAEGDDEEREEAHRSGDPGSDRPRSGSAPRRPAARRRLVGRRRPARAARGARSGGRPARGPRAAASRSRRHRSLALGGIAASRIARGRPDLGLGPRRVVPGGRLEAVELGRALVVSRPSRGRRGSQAGRRLLGAVGVIGWASNSALRRGSLRRASPPVAETAFTHRTAAVPRSPIVSPAVISCSSGGGVPARPDPDELGAGHQDGQRHAEPEHVGAADDRTDRDHDQREPGCARRSRSERRAARGRSSRSRSTKAAAAASVSAGSPTSEPRVIGGGLAQHDAQQVAAEERGHDARPEGRRSGQGIGQERGRGERDDEADQSDPRIAAR